MKVHLELPKISIAAVPTALLLAGLLTPQRCGAQQATAGTDSASAMAATTVGLVAPTGPAARRAENEELPAKATRHGIRIHGHWVIDVRNPDGKLVEHRDFENSLVKSGSLLSGDQLLAGLLSGNFTAGDAGIGLVQGTPGADPSTFCDTNIPLIGNVATVPPNTTCFGLSTSMSGMTGYLANFATGLTSTVTFSPKVSWVLSGNYVTPASLTSISAVQTLVGACFSATAPFVDLIAPGSVLSGIKFTTATGRSADVPSTACFEVDSLPSGSLGGKSGIDELLFSTLTSTNLSTPLAVSSGQVVTVTVTISFS